MNPLCTTLAVLTSKVSWEVSYSQLNLVSRARPFTDSCSPAEGSGHLVLLEFVGFLFEAGCGQNNMARLKLYALEEMELCLC